jgi:hypothetical protein
LPKQVTLVLGKWGLEAEPNFWELSAHDEMKLGTEKILPKFVFMVDLIHT